MKVDRSSVFIVISLHIVAVLAITFFASKEGMLGKKMQSLSVALVPKEKPVEQPKPKVEEKIIDVASKQSIEVPKAVEQPQQKVETPIHQAPEAVPQATQMPSFEFSDGAKEVKTISDPNELYKTYIERYLKSQWKLPETDGIVEIEMNIDEKGKILSSSFQVRQGQYWEKSVLDLLKIITNFPKPPPKGFPLQFKIRFDTTME